MSEHDAAVAHALERLDAALAAWHRAKLRAKAVKRFGENGVYCNAEIHRAVRRQGELVRQMLCEYSDAFDAKVEADRKAGGE